MTPPVADRPLYTSACTAKNLFQKYEIFPDHLQMHTVFGNFAVPFSEIERVEVFPPILTSLRLHLRNWRLLGVKLDLTDFNEHIFLDKKTGFVRQLLFTPDNPSEFREALEKAMAANAPASGSSNP
jgi:hypothetical protein